jgi:phospholipid/cholesterol/gamma-HCH transport system ATP-binding protein
MSSLVIESLQFDALSFQFETGESVFEAVDFKFPIHQTVWVKAESGSGRSTLLQILAGLQVPSKGRYLINDQPVSEMTFEEFMPYRLQIGYGFDFGGLINNRTLEENLTLPLAYHNLCSQSEAEEKARFYLKELGALKYKDMRPALVPGGVRKLTCLIRALIHEPQMLLLDDPNVGLSQDTILKYFDLIERLKAKGKCQHVFISSFDEKLMNLLPHTEIFVDSGMIYHMGEDVEKKVVNL